MRKFLLPLLLLMPCLGMAQEQRTIQLDEAGTLDQQISEEEKYSITDGTITFADDNIPQINDYIYIDCNFYTIVRFSNDFLPVIRKSNNLFELPDITLIEVQK